MAQSPSSQHRARLIREMSRDLNRPRHSSTSSKGSHGSGSVEPTISNFDPENEALMSTRQLDNTTQRLPELRASAQKYRRFLTGPESDFVIDTSAIGRAFPDFTQGGVSSDDGSISIELGRGVKSGGSGTVSQLGRPREYASHPQGDDSMDLSAPMIGDYKVMSTPPLHGNPTSKKENDLGRGSVRRDAQLRRASLLRKETKEPSPPLAKTTDYVSGGSRQSSGEHRRTLAAMHARVTDEDDGSRISDERPPTLNLTARNTRFGSAANGKPMANNSPPSKYSSTKGFAHALSQGNMTKQQNLEARAHNGTFSSHTNPVTQQSFMLPDLPNLSELVSGVYQDGTPVFSRQGKSRASRFVSSSRRPENSNQGPEHADVVEVPLPEEEQAIFISLRILQDKVGDLEHNRAEAEATIKDLQQKNQMLERESAEARRWRRSDSALGTTDGGSDAGDETGRGSRRQRIEKTRLEATIRALQEQLDASNRKTSVSDIEIRNLTQERDAAVSQLGVAYFTTEQLKVENEGLRDDIETLKRRIAQLTADREDQTQNWKQKEKGLPGKISRRKDAIHGLHDLTRDNVDARGPSSTQDLEKLNRIGRNHGHARATDADQECRVVNEMAGDKRQSAPLPLEIERPAYTEKEQTQCARTTIPKPDSTRPGNEEIPRVRKQRVVIQEYSESETSEDSNYEAMPGENRMEDRGPSGVQNVDDVSQDMTFLSFLESGEIAKLRKTLEQERIARRQRIASNSRASRANVEATETGRPDEATSSRQPVLPRKSSMKDFTGEITRQGIKDDQTTRSKTGTIHNRRHSEDSLLSRHDQRRGLSMENMTSAFIVPDITMQIPGTATEPAPKLSLTTPQLADGNAQHDGGNCTVCECTIKHGVSHNHGGDNEKIRIPKPVPVSERMPESMPYEEEPTIRPSQPPAIALATVMKGLQDELDHLKMELSKYQTLYNQHDPALSRRKRKAVYEKIQCLLKTIDVKSDQIYSLYDVLEGQKADGHEISEEQIEVTLQSIGIDLERLVLRGGNAPNESEKPAGRNAWEVDSADDEEEEGLPWEGIESTVHTTKSGNGRGSRRGSGTA